MNERIETLQTFLDVIQQLGDHLAQTKNRSPSLADAVQQLHDAHTAVAEVRRDEEERLSRTPAIEGVVTPKTAPAHADRVEEPPATVLDPQFGQIAKEELFRQFGSAGVASAPIPPSPLSFSDWTNSSRELLLSASVSRNPPPARKSSTAADDSRQRSREWFDKAKTTFDDK